MIFSDQAAKGLDSGFEPLTIKIRQRCPVRSQFHPVVLREEVNEAFVFTDCPVILAFGKIVLSKAELLIGTYNDRCLAQHNPGAE